MKLLFKFKKRQVYEPSLPEGWQLIGDLWAKQKWRGRWRCIACLFLTNEGKLRVQPEGGRWDVAFDGTFKSGEEPFYANVQLPYWIKTIIDKDDSK